MSKEQDDVYETLMKQIKLIASHEQSGIQLSSLAQAYIALVDSRNPRRWPAGIDSGAALEQNGGAA